MPLLEHSSHWFSVKSIIPASDYTDTGRLWQIVSSSSSFWASLAGLSEIGDEDSLLWGMWRNGSWQGWQSVTSQIGSPGPWKQMLPWTVLSQVHLEFVSLVSMTQEKTTEEHWLKWNIAVDKDKRKDDHTVSNNTQSSFSIHTDAVGCYLQEQVPEAEPRCIPSSSSKYSLGWGCALAIFETVTTA